MSTNTITNDTAVFDNYRAALRTLRKNYTGETRTGERKQRALKIVADRRKMPISDVKSVVKRIEAEKGITHEHTQEYINRLNRATKAKNYEDGVRVSQKNDGITDGSILACETCGSTNPDDNVRVRVTASNCEHCFADDNRYDEDGRAEYSFIVECESARRVTMDHNITELEEGFSDGRSCADVSGLSFRRRRNHS